MIFSLPLATLPFPDIDPVIFELGPLAVHWYGLGYVVGILFAQFYAARLLANSSLWRDNTPPFARQHTDDFVLWAALGVVVGGRLGYVLFYNPAHYAAKPLNIFAITDGGMSFHGGLIGVIFAVLLFSRLRQLPILALFDAIVPGIPVGIGLVRLTNFINSELWGRITDVPWAVIFPNGGPFPRHPSQIYEALLEGLVLFIILRICTFRMGTLKIRGLTAGIFLTGYGTFRTFVEFFRQPDQHIGYLFDGWLTMGILLSLPMVLTGLLVVLLTLRRNG